MSKQHRDGGTRERGNLLTTREMGTNRGRAQTDPLICFHSVYITSHTKNACPVITTNSRTKNAVNPEVKRLAHKRLLHHGKGVGCIVHAQSRIFFCSCQGVIRITVNKMETLAPLLEDKSNDTLDRISRQPHQIGTQKPTMAR